MLSKDREMSFVDEEIGIDGFSHLAFHSYNIAGILFFSLGGLSRDSTPQWIRDHILATAYYLEEDPPQDVDQDEVDKLVQSLKEEAQKVPGL